MQRRDFLTAGYTSLLSATLLNSSSLKSTIFAHTADEIAEDIISIGYFYPGANLASGRIKPPRQEENTNAIRLLNQELEKRIVTERKTLETKLKDHLLAVTPEGFRTLKEQVIQPQEAKPIENSIGTFEPNVITARHMSSGDPSFTTRLVKVRLLGFYTAAPPWKNGDLGTLSVRVKFDEVESNCVKISNVTFGDSFFARKNDIVPQFSTSPLLINKAGVKKRSNLGLSFDLVDVADPTDKNIAARIFEIVKTIAPVKTLIDPFLPYIDAGSKILDVFGKNIFANPSNRQLWALKNEVNMTIDSDESLPKLQRGIYFIAGKSKETGSHPAWEDYMLRANTDNNAGERLYLYRQEGTKLIPADFSYLLMSIDYAE